MGCEAGANQLELAVQLRVELENRASERLDSLGGRELSDARRRLVERAMQEALLETLRVNPVDTGRSRAAWAAAVRQMGVDVPSDWRGPHSHAAAISEGAARGAITRADGESTTAVSAQNSVRYVGFLEYGTRKMAPFAMVRRALARVQQQLSRWFEFPAR